MKSHENIAFEVTNGTFGTRTSAVASSLGNGLLAALEEYQSLVKEGKRPAREEFLARHPEHAEALADCLEGLDFVLSAAPELIQGRANESVRSDASGSIAPTTRLGDYRIVREIGRGGMGIVFEAEQVSLGRTVAIKILPFAAALDERQRQRFELEAQAAAHLNHPHIVPVYSVGQDQGVHYYTMQLIDGESLSEVLRAIRREGDAGDPGEKSSHRLTTLRGSAEDFEPDEIVAATERDDGDQRSPRLGTAARDQKYYRDVARVGMQAAEALEHAHSLGIIHRDIKPANLLLDAKNDLWLTDFGLARFLEEPGLTCTGDLLGTIAYMSPEQAMGKREVDHRTDIYSLGATLYELLTLRPVFSGREREELIQKISHADPERPRLVNRSVPRDLETIVLKAMEKEPSGRYACMRDFAEDLRRFLDDKPILARPPTIFEKTAKWSRRHRPAVVTALVLLPILLAVGTAMLWQEQRRTQQALKAVREGFADAFELADAVTMLAMEYYTIDNMNARANPHKQDVNKLYQTAHDLYVKVANQPATDPEMEAMVARANQRAGFTKIIMRQPGGDQSYQRAVDQYESLLTRYPKSRAYSTFLAYTLSDWGTMTTVSRGFAAAENHYRRALDTFVQAAEQDLLEPEDLYHVCSSLSDMIEQFRSTGREAEASKVRNAVESIYRGVLAKHPVSPDVRRFESWKHASYALERAQAGVRNGSEFVYRLGLIIDPYDHRLNNDFAWLLVGRPDQAPYDPAEAVRMAKIAVREKPTDGLLLNTLGVANFRVGDNAGALKAFEQSMAFRKGGDAFDWLFVAMIKHRTGDKNEAQRWYEKAQAQLKEKPSDDPDLTFFERECAVEFGHAPPVQNKTKGPTPSSKRISRPVEPKPPGEIAASRRGGLAQVVE